MEGSMTNAKQKKRARVTGVTINVVYPDGNPGTITIDPKITKALFWDDQTVSEILAPYYEAQKPTMTRKVMIDLFGTRGQKVADWFKPKGKKAAGDEIPVDKEVIEALWTEKDENGNAVTLLAKSIFCTPAPGGD